MRKLLNTLYVTSTDNYLSRDGENVVILAEQAEKFRIPIHNLEAIITFGYTGASPGLMHLCAERGVALTFLNEHGGFRARIQGKTSGNVLLRRKQYKFSDGPEALQIAKRMIQAKVINSRTVINRAIRDYGEQDKSSQLQPIAVELKRLSHMVIHVDNLDTLRGVEGEAAKHYFSGMNELILTEKKAFMMTTRNRRPPKDRINALLSFLYTMLRLDVQAALETVGLDPAVGFLHRDRPGRASLALDLMEELRPYLADRLALTLINRKQISPKSFIIKENGAVLLSDEGRNIVLSSWQQRKKEEIRHPFLDETIEVGLIPYAQALLLARFIRGDIEDYPPYLWK
ncbi:type I-C CRISPR-associated endonuclease Cas1c [Paenibacillus brevis]|uniref:CRISPR-associated endonuclease Cas1 n=1 Tax=Paenibacillus brevis TaxID=2841508 RepID=A0ABS6FSS2_9BACL|nr:type I-C CRISPR-associated endonuclease Cas1c [Paenibacillus brevis]MBU5673282.1 type I-C CRISPR-associated endonuclease Cas1c [Paenibacillus brevis]